MLYSVVRVERKSMPFMVRVMGEIEARCAQGKPVASALAQVQDLFQPMFAFAVAARTSATTRHLRERYLCGAAGWVLSSESRQ